MTSPQRIEVALRAGIIAKIILQMTETESAVVARMGLLEAVSNIRKLDEMLSGFANAQTGKQT